MCFSKAPLPQHMTLEAAVDLTKKSSEADWRQGDDGADEQDDTDSDTPLDMSVTATTRLTPVFPGFSRDLSPARSDRSESLIRLPGVFSPGSVALREWSTERSEADKGRAVKKTSFLLRMLTDFFFNKKYFMERKKKTKQA